MEANEVLEAEVLRGIQPFSGLPGEMAVADRIISEGKALQRVQTLYTTAVAVQQPRSMSRVTKNVLEEAKLAGAAFYYRWEVENKKTGRKSTVQGPSIDLTMCIARNYGNCALDIDVEETLSYYLFKGTFIDLETGFTVPRLFRQRKKQNIGGRYDDDRAEDMVFQIGQSKAQRNCIAKAAPGWLVDQAIDEARQAEINKIKPENLHIARSKVLDFFATYGITEERMERKMERKADLWTAENIADLRGMATALKEGRISPDELFPDIEPNEEPTKVVKPAQASQAAPQSTKSPDPEPEAKDPFREEWINLRGAGFSTYVHTHLEELRTLSPEDLQEIKAKWAKLYDKTPWPLDLKEEKPIVNQTQGFLNNIHGKNTDENARRLSYLDSCHKAKQILGNEQYYAVLTGFSMSSMNSCPNDPEAEEKVIDALNRAVDQLNPE